MAEQKKKALVLTPAAEGALRRLVDATLANTCDGVFTTTEVARCIGIDSVPRAAHLVGELHRAGYLTTGEKLVPRTEPVHGVPRSHYSAVAWRVSRRALLDEIQSLRRALWKAENPDKQAENPT